MTTRTKIGIFKPKTYLTTVQQLEPFGVKAVLNDPKWFLAIQEEHTALMTNQTWQLVPSHEASKMIGSKCVFRVQHQPNGSILKYKAKLVAKGFHQTHGIDYFETFSQLLKHAQSESLLALLSCITGALDN